LLTSDAFAPAGSGGGLAANVNTRLPCAATSRALDHDNEPQHGIDARVVHESAKPWYASFTPL
jgi:hypothetical protein